MFGDVKHDKSILRGTQIRGEDRQKIAERCTRERPRHIHKDLLHRFKKNILDFGNVSDVPSKS